MDRKLLVTAVVVAVFLAPLSTRAATPSISGNYAVSYTEICPAYSPNPQKSFDGIMNVMTLLAAFNSSKKVVSFTGTMVSGPVVLWAGSNQKIGTSSVNTSPTYSNTANTFTTDLLTPSPTVYNVVYGPVVSGIAQSFVFGGLTNAAQGAPNPGCAASGTAIRQ